MKKLCRIGCFFSKSSVEDFEKCFSESSTEDFQKKQLI
jgi:hypothetical protein